MLILIPLLAVSYRSDTNNGGLRVSGCVCSWEFHRGVSQCAPRACDLNIRTAVRSRESVSDTRMSRKSRRGDSRHVELRTVRAVS